MVVRFVCVVRVPLCARVSRERLVFVPAPPGVFLPAVESAADSVVSRSLGCVGGLGWL